MKINNRILINCFVAAVIAGVVLVSLQGCTSSSKLELVDGGITPPVAEQAQAYLPAAYAKDEQFDVFSFDTTAESLLELDIELEESAVEDEYELELKEKAEEPAPVSVETLPQEYKAKDEPINQEFACALPLYGPQDFYSGVSSCVETSFLFEADSQSVRNPVSKDMSNREEEFVAAVKIDVEDIVGCDDLNDALASNNRLTNNGGLQTDVYMLEPASAENGCFLEVDSWDDESTVVYATDLMSMEKESEVVNTSVELQRKQQKLEQDNTMRGAEPISGIDSTAMLEQAHRYEGAVIALNETKLKKMPKLFSEKNNDLKKDKAEKNVVKLTLAEAIRMSLGGNPDVVAASYSSKQAEERLNASKTVYDPILYQNLNGESKEDLDADYYYLIQNPIMSTSGWSIEGGLRQPLPTGGNISVAYEYAETMQDGVGKELFRGVGGPVVTLNQSLLRGLGDIDNKTAIKISRLNASMAQADFVVESMDSVYEVCAAYWTLVFYLEQMAIQKRVLAMAKEVYIYEKTRKGRGISRKLNEERAYAAVEVRRSNLLRMRDNVLAALDELVLLLGNDDYFNNADLVLPTDRPLVSFVKFELEQAEEVALAMRPELMREYSGVEVGKAKKRLADEDKLPTLDLKARYGLAEGNLGLNDNTLNNRYDKYAYNSGYWEVGLAFEYKLGSRAAKAAYREADALISEKKAMVNKLKREVKVEVRAAGRTLTTAQRNMKITFNARKAALEVLEGERVRFKLGLTTNEELLRSQEYLAEREMDYFRAIIDCNVNALKLARAKGTILSDLGVDIAGINKY